MNQPSTLPCSPCKKSHRSIGCILKGSSLLAVRSGCSIPLHPPPLSDTVQYLWLCFCAHPTPTLGSSSPPDPRPFPWVLARNMTGQGPIRGYTVQMARLRPATRNPPPRRQPPRPQVLFSGPHQDPFDFRSLPSHRYGFLLARTCEACFPLHLTMWLLYLGQRQ